MLKNFHISRPNGRLDRHRAQGCCAGYGPIPTLTLVANSEISTLQVRHVSENSVYQYAGLHENEFATSVLVGFRPASVLRVHPRHDGHVIPPNTVNIDIF
jgi:hypothetical protein